LINVILKIFAIGVLLVIIGYFGLCAWANFVPQKEPGQLDLPKVEQAAYTVHVKNTGGVMFTSDYDHVGQVYVLHGYWELRGQEFVYVKGDIVLDEQIFGAISIQKRAKR